MRVAIYWISAVLTSFALGVGTLVVALGLEDVGKNAGFSGPWGTAELIGDKDADPYLRAIIAVRGTLALSRKETQYYTAGTDNKKTLLYGSCTYHLEGKDLPGRWWSITAYDAAYGFLIKAKGDRYSISKTTVKRKEDGSYLVVLSPDKQEGNWISLKPKERFLLVARIYNPEASVRKDSTKISLPTITRKECKK